MVQTDKLQSSVALIRRFRNPGSLLETQFGRLVELQEIAAELRVNPNTTISFNWWVSGSVGKTDVDVLQVGKAIELKQSLANVSDKDFIKKFVKYFGVPQAGKRIELRSFDSVDDMQAAVHAAFNRYALTNETKWPIWLKNLDVRKETLEKVRDSVTFKSVESSRYNFFTGAAAS